MQAMSYPGPIIPPVFGTENLHDDDADVISSYDIEVDSPPDLAKATDVIPTPAVADPVKLTRIITREYYMDITNFPANIPVLLLQPDPNRISLTVRVFSPTSVATDGIRLSSDLGDVYSAGRLFHSQSSSDAFASHTGALYAVSCSNAVPSSYPPAGASAPVYVEVWSVTK